MNILYVNVILEKIFDNYDRNKENEDRIYHELNYNVRKELTKCFHGFEVTDFFLEEMDVEEPYMTLKYSKYQSSFANFEIYSAAFFDTSPFDVISEKIKRSNKRL